MYLMNLTHAHRVWESIYKHIKLGAGAVV